jgi:hypothetical protein
MNFEIKQNQKGFSYDNPSMYIHKGLVTRDSRDLFCPLFPLNFPVKSFTVKNVEVCDLRHPLESCFGGFCPIRKFVGGDKSQCYCAIVGKFYCSGLFQLSPDIF